MKRAFPALLALLCATLALLIATSSSPLYAANFWTDTNIYFTIGRGMTRGLMPYRDLFDHKGPLLFMLYALGAAISDTSFIGVFIMEALSLAAAVYAGWRTVSLFGEGRLTLLSMPILAAVVCCCTAFTQGGSAEEFALPALAAGVYLALALMARPGEADGRRALGFGAAAGWVFLIKYTDIGLFAGLGIGLLAFVWRREGFGRALASAGRMLLGALLVCAPVAAYLAANGALAACVVLTSFITMLSGTGGNSGSQSSVAVIRALSLGEVEFSDMLAVVWKELRVALLCGTCLAGANFVKMMVVDRWLMHKPEVTVSVALVVCLTLLLTVVCAKIVGCTLPMAAEKVGIDPAVMAAPFITTVVDALSLLIYFAIATEILGL